MLGINIQWYAFDRGVKFDKSLYTAIYLVVALSGGWWVGMLILYRAFTDIYEEVL